MNFSCGWTARPVFTVNISTEGKSEIKLSDVKFSVGFSARDRGCSQNLAGYLHGSVHANRPRFEKLSVDYSCNSAGSQFHQLLFKTVGYSVHIGLGDNKDKNSLAGFVYNDLVNLNWSHNLFLNG